MAKELLRLKGKHGIAQNSAGGLIAPWKRGKRGREFDMSGRALQKDDDPPHRKKTNLTKGIPDTVLQEMFREPGPRTSDQGMARESVRVAALQFATAIQRATAPCADQTTAIRRVREATFIALAAIDSCARF